jgi:hypothetical protein
VWGNGGVVNLRQLLVVPLELESVVLVHLPYS